MDDSLTQTFVSECEESIVDLNNALLALESNPEDREAMDSIFRRAHTLKGNFGAMGYDDGQTVAHAVEDLLDAVRQGRIEITPDRMDVVFEGVDAVERIVEEIRESGASSTAVDDVVDRVRAAAEEDGKAASEHDTETQLVADTDASGAGEASAVDGAATNGDATAAGSFASESLFDPSSIDADDPLVAVHLTLREGGMKSVDAALVLGAVPDDLTVHDARPSLDDIEGGEFDDGFDLCVSGAPADEVQAAFAGVWGVGSATATAFTGPDATAEVPESDGIAAGTNGASDTPTTNENAGTGGGSDDAGAGTDSGSDDAGAGGGSDASEDGGKRSGNGALSGHEIRSVRVDVGQLDELHELVEQLVTSRIKLRRVIEEGGVKRADDMMDEVDKVSGNLQNTVMDMRLIPVKKVFGKFPRLVRDLARAQDKDIDFVMEGQDIELDRTILDQVSDPLMHILRNAGDHGIEPPAEREAAGKPRQGTIELKAIREHDHVVIQVADDGRGLDADRLREKAVENGAITQFEADAMDDGEAYNLVFHAGLSTAEEITDISGRGVGMDVAVTTVRGLDGSVDVDSTPGEGTTVSVRLPVTVAIIKILLVQVGSREYGVPITSIDEIARATDIDTINGDEVLVHDERIYPLVRLHDVLDVPEEPDGDGMVIRIRPEERACALHCDRVNQQEEVVVKPFTGPLTGVHGFSGAAVIGDGNIIPILDVATLGTGFDVEVLV